MPNEGDIAIQLRRLVRKVNLLLQGLNIDEAAFYPKGEYALAFVRGDVCLPLVKGTYLQCLEFAENHNIELGYIWQICVIPD